MVLAAGGDSGAVSFPKAGMAGDNGRVTPFSSPSSPEPGSASEQAAGPELRASLPENASSSEPPSSKAVFAQTTASYVMPLAVFFVAVMMISTLTGTKGVQLGPLNTDGAFYLFPLAYVLGDVMSEVYGFRTMRRVVWVGFSALILMSLCMWITIELPAASFYTHQDAFVAVAGVVPQILGASLAGYLVGEILNSWVLVKIKERTGEKSLWARLLGSTMVGELADTLIFCTIAASAIGIASGADFFNYVVVGYLWKTCAEIVVMPLTYLVVKWIKRREPSYQATLEGVPS